MADITLAQLTEGTVTGSGVFDELMKSVSAHLDDQYQKNRITGADYATVYLGAMQSAMSQSVQFLLGEQAADKQAELLVKQALTEVAKEINTTKQSNLLVKQELTEIAKELKIDKDTLILTNVDLTEVAKATKLGKESDVLTNAAATELTKATNTTAQTSLLAQKTETELAQTSDFISDGVTSITGTVSKQKVLLEAQTDGFARDAEQKLLKIMMDVFSIQRTTNDIHPAPNKAANLSIDDVIDTAAKGIGITTIYTTPP